MRENGQLPRQARQLSHTLKPCGADFLPIGVSPIAQYFIVCVEAQRDCTSAATLQTDDASMTSPVSTGPLFEVSS